MRLIYLALCIIILMVGCDVVIDEDRDKEDLNVSISSSIDRYTPIMSSVPGLPIDISLDSNYGLEDEIMVVSTETGNILIWKEDGSISTFEKSYETTVKSMTLYWQPVNTHDIEGFITEISVKIYDEDKTGHEVASTKLNIYIDSEGMYYVKD